MNDTERSFMQNWLDFCLSKYVGPGLDSCDSDWWFILPCSPALRAAKRSNHMRMKPREDDISVQSYLCMEYYFLFK